MLNRFVFLFILNGLSASFENYSSLTLLEAEMLGFQVLYCAIEHISIMYTRIIILKLV